MLKVVFDTVIFVRALLNPHSFSGRLVFMYRKKYHLIISPPLVEETLSVLGRAEIVRKFHLKQVDYPTALARLVKSMESAEIVYLTEDILSISRDPKDDKFLATAKAAHAAYVVTEDTDLLVLKEYGGVKIITAAAFLRILETP